MTSRLRYDNAPIAEAIIDLRVDPSENVDTSTFDRLCQDRVEEYPDVSPIFAAQGTFQVSAAGETRASAQHSQVGYHGKSKDGRQVCQWQTAGFTFSRLPPYDRWEPFRDEARRHWGAYQQLAKPKWVVRVAVRYVNRIVIPELTFDLKKYFRTSSEIAPELPQAMAGFFMQVRIPQEDIGAMAVLNQTHAEQPPPTTARLRSPSGS